MRKHQYLCMLNPSTMGTIQGVLRCLTGKVVAISQPWRQPLCWVRRCHLLPPFRPQRVGIALAARNTLYHLPLVLADQLGYFRNEGVLIDWLDCESGSQAMQMAVNGQADIVSGAFEHVLDLQTTGSAFRAFVLLARAPQLSVGLASRKASGVKNHCRIESLEAGHFCQRFCNPLGGATLDASSGFAV